MVTNKGLYALCVKSASCCLKHTEIYRPCRIDLWCDALIYCKKISMASDCHR